MTDYGPDPLGLISRAEYGEFMAGGGTVHYRVPDAGEVHYRPAYGAITSVDGVRVAGTALHDRPAATDEHRLPRNIRHITGRPLHWGAIGRTDGRRGTGGWDEFFADARSVSAVSRPNLRFNHDGREIGHYVRAESDAIGWLVRWRLHDDLPDTVLRYLATQERPLSIGFRALTPPRVTRPSGERELHAQRHVEITHVAVVASPAYTRARLHRLAL